MSKNQELRTVRAKAQIGHVRWQKGPWRSLRRRFDSPARRGPCKPIETLRLAIMWRDGAEKRKLDVLARLYGNSCLIVTTGKLPNAADRYLKFGFGLGFENGDKNHQFAHLPVIMVCLNM